MDSNKDGKAIDIEILVATASNDWKSDPIPPMKKEGERRILWPLNDSQDDDYPSLGPGFLW